MNRAIATMTLVRRRAAVALAMASMASGCFYPPTQKPPAPSKDEVTLAQPYDMVWDAVHNVIRENKLRVNADDPNQGIVETETNQFTLDDADCGKLNGVSGKYAAVPDRAATAVYYSRSSLRATRRASSACRRLSARRSTFRSIRRATSNASRGARPRRACSSR